MTSQDVGVVYLLRQSNPIGNLARAVEHYRQHPEELGYELIVIFKEFSEEGDDQAALEQLDVPFTRFGPEILAVHSKNWGTGSS